eukprot:COSAG01_NODE_51370_length_355_cov_0.941406_1_plen_25_part_10
MPIRTDRYSRKRRRSWISHVGWTHL